MSETATTASERIYAEATRRTNGAQVAFASVITLLTLGATWGEWDRFAVVVEVQLALIAFNAWVTLRLLARLGSYRAEVVRASVNVSSSVVLGHFTGWPLPIWLWLPYVALAFEHFGPRILWGTLTCLAVALGGAALLDGVPPQYPIAFIAFAYCCAYMSSVRGREIREMLMASDVQRRDLERAHAIIHTAHDRLQRETEARARVEIELRQAQKLEAVGRLAAGIAHEINTPIQFVGDSLEFLRSASGDLFALVERYRAAQRAIFDELPGHPAAREVAAAEEELDYAYIAAHLPSAFTRSAEGLERLAGIVRSMKDFAHPDQKEMQPMDLNRAIEATITIARSEYKRVADVETELEVLPTITGHAGELNQVLLNLLVNASHAIGDKAGDAARRGLITVRSFYEAGEVRISVSDTGCGIPPEIRHRIFEPFFTTKEVGRGTGQGLAIAHSIVTRHGGSISSESEVGIGTTFTIVLPLVRTPRNSWPIFGETARASGGL
jgi:signal transduction histidine kinase